MASQLAYLIFLPLITSRQYIYFSYEQWLDWTGSAHFVKGNSPKSGFTAHSANAYCIDNHNQTLASFSNDDEFQQLLTIVQENDALKSFIGLTLVGLNWRFIDGSNCTAPLSHMDHKSGNYLCVTQWKDQEPNNFQQRGENCTELHKYSGKINDIVCGMNSREHSGAICNAPPNYVTVPMQVFSASSSSETFCFGIAVGMILNTLIVVIGIHFGVHHFCLKYMYPKKRDSASEIKVGRDASSSRDSESNTCTAPWHHHNESDEYE